MAILYLAIFVTIILLLLSNGAFVSVPVRSPSDFADSDILYEPLQTQLNDYQSASFRYYDDEDYQIQPLYNFEMVGRVLGTERYRLGNEADISPVDFALGWSKMADQDLIDKLSISQGGRWYRWSTNDRSINPAEISQLSSNIHMVPADDSIRKRLLSIDDEDLVYLRGYLIEASKADSRGSWRWTSSLTRTDTGNGACELFYVEDVALVE